MPSQNDSKPPRFEVDRIYFSLQLFKAMIPIKFKCRFFVQIKTFSASSNTKILAKSKDAYRATNSLIKFDNELLQFDSYLVYDNQINSYKKKQIQIIVNLISDNRGDETKLVGRIKFDLADFMIQNMAETLRKQQQLENCSVKKPQVAKLQYQLKLVRQCKLNIQTSPQKQSIFAQIQKGLFSDASEYNQLYREVFGNQQSNSSVLNTSGVRSKLNRSIAQNGNKTRGSNKQINSTKLIQNQKVQEQYLQKTKSPLIQKNKPIQTEQKEQTKQDPNKQQKGLQQSNKQGIPARKHTIPRKSQKTVANRQKGQSPPKRNILKSSTKIIAKSQQPERQLIQRQSLPLKQNQEGGIQPEQHQHQYLTSSMFDEQQIVIQSLHEHLQQANQIIEQYRLELDLMKEEAEKLRLQRQAHHHQQQVRSRQKFISAQKSAQNQNLNAQLQNARTRLQQYKKVVIQKQGIIEQKNKVILSLQNDLQSANMLFQQKLIEKDQLNEELTNEYIATDRFNKDLQKKLLDKQEQNKTLSQMVQQLKKSVELLDESIKSFNVSQLHSGITQKDKKIKDLSDLIQLQKASTFQFELKVLDLEQKIKQVSSEAQSMGKQITKKQETVHKYHALKQKAQQQMNKAIQNSKTIQKERYTLTQQITALNLKNKSVQKLVDEKVLSYKKQLQQLQQSYEEAQDKIAELKSAVHTYQSTLQEEQGKNNRQVQQLTKKLQNFNKKQHLLRQSLEMLQNQTNKIRIYVQDKQSKVRQYQELLQAREVQLADKDEKMNYVLRKLRMAQSTAQQLKMQIKIVQAMSPFQEPSKSVNRDEQEQLQARLSILMQTNLELLQKQKAQSYIFERRQQRIDQLQRKLSSMDGCRGEVRCLEQKLSLHQKKNEELKEQLKLLTRSSMQQKSKLQQEFDQLQHLYNECEKFQNEVRTLQEQRFVSFAQNSQNEAQISLLQVNLQSLGQQLRYRDKENTQLHTMVQKHQATAAQFLQHIDQLQKQVQSLNSQKQHPQQHANKSPPFLSSKTRVVSSSSRLQRLPSEIKTKITQIQIIQKQTDSGRRDKRASSQYSHRSKQQEEVYVLREELQGYKQREEQYMCNVLDLQMQLDKIKQEKLTLSTSMNQQMKSMSRNKSMNVMRQPERKQLRIACDQLQKLIQERVKSRQTQSILQVLISNSQLFMNSQSHLTNQQCSAQQRQKNYLQQKSRILSRQVQKIKSLILKKSQMSLKDKTFMIQIFKPCQNITNQIIKIVENYTKQNDEEILTDN